MFVIVGGQGALGPTEKLTADLTILASDDPYGVFIIPSDNRPIVTPSAFTGNLISFLTLSTITQLTIGFVSISHLYVLV